MKPAPHQFMAVVVSDHARIDCLKREIALRRRVYPRLVEQGKMTQTRADSEIEVMQAILDDYTARGDLFGGMR